MQDTNLLFGCGGEEFDRYESAGVYGQPAQQWSDLADDYIPAGGGNGFYCYGYGLGRVGQCYQTNSSIRGEGFGETGAYLRR